MGSLILDPSTLTHLQTTCNLLRNAEDWRDRGVTIPRGLLLCGEPGTGKTQIARTLANESRLSFLEATTSDMKANYLGQSGNKVKISSSEHAPSLHRYSSSTNWTSSLPAAGPDSTTH